MENTIVSQLEEPFYYHTSDSEWDSHFSDKGVVVLALSDRSPAGYAMGSFATRAGGHFVSIANEVANKMSLNSETLFWLDGVGVMPDFRGRGLQRKMSAVFEQEAVKMGATGFLATVAHQNVYSLRNFLDRGYGVVMESDLDGRSSRLIVYGQASRLVERR